MYIKLVLKIIEVCILYFAEYNLLCIYGTVFYDIRCNSYPIQTKDIDNYFDTGHTPFYLCTLYICC